jgi:low affinity Fe/Cu permease
LALFFKKEQAFFLSQAACIHKRPRTEGTAMSAGADVTMSARVSGAFSAAAVWTAQQMGRASTFMLACLAIVAWAVTGPMFHYSDTWQLVINTGTTIITFLMVFLIQNTQNRDMAALHLKLDELIRVNRDARNTLLNLEDMTEEELQRIKGSFATLAAAGDPARAGQAETGRNMAGQA